MEGGRMGGDERTTAVCCSPLARVGSGERGTIDFCNIYLIEESVYRSMRVCIETYLNKYGQYGQVERSA